MQKRKQKIAAILLICFISSISFSALATEEVKAYSLGEITQIALDRNPTIKSAVYKAEGVEITRDRADTALSYIPAEGFYVSPEPLIFYKQVQAINRGYANAKDNVQIEIDSVKYEVLTKYQELINIQEKLKLEEKKLAETKEDMSRAVLKRNYGLLSEIETEAAIETYNIGKNSLAKLHEDEEKAYSLLNTAAGIYTSERYQVAPEVVVSIEEELKDSDLTRFISNAKNGLLTRILERNLEQTELSYNFYVFNDPTESRSYDAVGKDLDSEKASIAATKENLADAVRTIFYQARELQKNYRDLETKDRLDQRSYEIKKIQFDNGMITKSQLTEAERTLDENKANLLALQNGFNQVIFMLNYPHVAAR